MATDNNGSASGFDAGGDFIPVSDAIANLVAGKGEAAPPPEAAADEEPADDSSQEGTWADPNEEAEQAPKTAKAAGPAAPVLEVKGPKGVKRYDLNADNAELKRALEYAEGFRPMQAQRDKAMQETKALKAQLAAVSEKGSVWDELQSLAQAGHTDRVVRAVLGDQAYAQYRKLVKDEEVGYESADPAERLAIEKARTERESQYKATQYDKRVKELETKLQAQEDRVETDRLRGIGQQALAKFSFNDAVPDAELAEALNNELWTSSWNRLESLADEGHEITPQLVSKVFAQKSKVLRGGAAKVADTRVQQIVETKKQAAKQQAQVAATARYPSQAPASKVDGWNGASMTDLIRRLRSR
jgi:hypothetical protein